MALVVSELLALALACAPGVAAETVLAVVRAESDGDPLAIHVNGGVASLDALARPRPDTPEHAARIARAALAAGATVDLGLMQVNSANLDRLGTTVERMFDPCANLAAGAAILEEAYARATARFGPGRAALESALSAYNTGDFARGFANGYVARVTGAAPTATSTAATPAGDPIAAADPFAAPTTVYTGSIP